MNSFKQANFFALWMFRFILLLAAIGFGIAAAYNGQVKEAQESWGVGAGISAVGLLFTFHWQDEIMSLGDDDDDN